MKYPNLNTIVIICCMIACVTSPLFGQESTDVKVIRDVAQLKELRTTVIEESITISGVDKTTEFRLDGKVIDEPLVFNQCYFALPVNVRSVFEKNVIIQNSRFAGGANFSGSSFSDELSFSEVTFDSPPVFQYCLLPSTLSFRRLEVKGGKIDLSTARIVDKKCKLQCQEMDMTKLIVPYDLFEFDFDQVDSDTNSYSFSQKITIYEALIKNCKEAGLLSSAEDWDIAYMKEVNQEQYPLLYKPLNFINEVWWNFGYDRWRIFWVWTPLLFIIFFIANTLMIKKLVEAYYEDEIGGCFIDDGADKKMLIRHHRLAFSFVYTAMIYFNFRLSLSGLNFKNALSAYVLMVYGIGTLHVVFGIAGYILRS